MLADVIEEITMELNKLRTGFNLKLMPLLKNPDGIPQQGKKEIIVAAVKDQLHFRVFDGEGKQIENKHENELEDQEARIEDLRKQLESLWSRLKLTESEKGRVISAVASILGTQGRDDFRVCKVKAPALRLVWSRAGSKPPNDPPATVPELEITELEQNYNQSYALWEPNDPDERRFPSDHLWGHGLPKKVKGEKRSVWRIKRFLGFREVKAPVIELEKDPDDASLLVIDDAGYGFRTKEEEKKWPRVLQQKELGKSTSGRTQTLWSH